MLLLGFCGPALSFFATALATALWMLIVVRLVSGAMQSNLAIANAYVADNHRVDTRIIGCAVFDQPDSRRRHRTVKCASPPHPPLPIVQGVAPAPLRVWRGASISAT